MDVEKSDPRHAFGSTSGINTYALAYARQPHPLCLSVPPLVCHLLPSRRVYTDHLLDTASSHASSECD
jgi:hypothetical protein